MIIPPEFDTLKSAALRALAPIKPVNSETQADRDFLFKAIKSEASKLLPAHYLLYFLLVELLGFRDLGRFEKISWSVPIDYLGRAFLIEYRKFGVGIFIQNKDDDEVIAKEIANKLNKTIKISNKFFDWLANQAVSQSNMNVNNESIRLFDRYLFFRTLYKERIQEAVLERDRFDQAPGLHDLSARLSNSMKLLGHDREAVWLAEAAVDSFFYWTEHVLIHLAILLGKINTAHEVAKLAESDWPEKFKIVLSIADPKTKKLFDELLLIRRELRNFVAHGSFGKDGEAFQFHSTAGAVPVLLPHHAGTNKFKLGRGNALGFEHTFTVIDNFIEHIWCNERKPAELYIQEAGLPCILTMAKDGDYKQAMTSMEEMSKLVDHLSYRIDQAANMDW